jgi:hypothetical protein
MVRPAPETGGELLLCLDVSEGLFQFVETVASTCQQFVYELETIGTPGRQRLSRLVVPLCAWVWPLDLSAKQFRKYRNCT